MPGTERDAFEVATFVGEGKDRRLRESIRARLLSLTIIGKDGERLFNEADVDALGKKSSKVLDRLLDAAQRLSGIGADDIEVLEKN